MKVSEKRKGSERVRTERHAISGSKLAKELKIPWRAP